MRRKILGRGCDPVRARFAKESWEPVLGAEIFTATSNEELQEYLTNGNKYEIFFIAPGMCSLIKSGRINGDALRQLVLKYQPDIKFVVINDVSEALPKLSEALGTTAVPGVQPLTEDWPFLD